MQLIKRIRVLLYYLEEVIVLKDTDMKIVPLGSSSTTFKHWRVPQNSVLRGCGVVVLRHKTHIFTGI